MLLQQKSPKFSFCESLKDLLKFRKTLKSLWNIENFFLQKQEAFVDDLNVNVLNLPPKNSSPSQI